MKCPLCEARKAKRLCPAKATHICPVCCGTKREVEIDCPSDCVYLHAGREYESEKLARTSPLPHRTERLWTDQFLRRYSGIVFSMSQVVMRTRRVLPGLVDSDVQAALDALVRTFETLSKGIYYDSAPDGLTQKKLYLELKLFLETPGEDMVIDERRLSTSQILDCLRFLRELSVAITLPRPKSRAFLDHLEVIAQGLAGGSFEESRLVLPAEL
jgi:hypothetical protein